MLKYIFLVVFFISMIPSAFCKWNEYHFIARKELKEILIYGEYHDGLEGNFESFRNSLLKSMNKSHVTYIEGLAYFNNDFTQGKCPGEDAMIRDPLVNTLMRKASLHAGMPGNIFETFAKNTSLRFVISDFLPSLWHSRRKWVTESKSLIVRELSPQYAMNETVRLIDTPEMYLAAWCGAGNRSIRSYVISNLHSFIHEEFNDEKDKNSRISLLNKIMESLSKDNPIDVKCPSGMITCDDTEFREDILRTITTQRNKHFAEKLDLSSENAVFITGYFHLPDFKVRGKILKGILSHLKDRGYTIEMREY